MPQIPDLLTPKRVALEQLLLDPNNPRFLDLEGEFGNTHEARFSEPGVQRAAFEHLKDRRFDVASLRDTIKTIGFLPIDKIVVRRWTHQREEPFKYVVLEGNRRVAALKWLLEQNVEGREQLNEAQIANFSSLDVLLLSEEADPNIGRWIIPGLRHVSGVKEWGTYQQAFAVKTLRESGMSPKDAAQSIGLTTRAANKLWRTFWALEQMKSDEDYGESADENLFSYFDEILKKPALQEWFGWEDNQKKFLNQDRIREFYSWIVRLTDDDDGEERDPKIGRAIDVRDLERVIAEPRALAVLRGANGTIEDASATVKAIHPEDWRAYVASTDSLLTALSPDSLRALAPEDVDSLERLKTRIQQLITDRTRLMGIPNGGPQV
jgi:hypothetical protein